MPLTFRRKNSNISKPNTVDNSSTSNNRRRRKRKNHRNVIDVHAPAPFTDNDIIAATNTVTNDCNYQGDGEEEEEETRGNCSSSIKDNSNALDEMTVGTSCTGISTVCTFETMTTSRTTTSGSNNENHQNDNESTTSSLVRRSHNHNQDDYDLVYSFQIWKSNINALVSSPLFQNVITSTISLSSTVTKSILHNTIQHPVIIKPIQHTISKIHSSLILVQHSTLRLMNQLLDGVKFIGNEGEGGGSRRDFDKKNEHLLLKINNDNSNGNPEEDNDAVSCEKTTTDTEADTKKNVDNLIKDLAFESVPDVYNATQEIISSSLSFLVGNGEDNNKSNKNKNGNKSATNHDDHTRIKVMNEIIESDDHEYIPIFNSSHDNVEENEQHGVIDSSTAIATTSTLPLNINSTTSTNLNQHESCHPNNLTSSSTPSFFIRVCDLNLGFHNQKENAIDKDDTNFIFNKEEKKESDSDSVRSCTTCNDQLLVLELKLALDHTSTLIRMNVVQMIEKMVDIGLKIVLNPNKNNNNNNNNSIMISWKEEGSTTRILKRMESSNDSTDNTCSIDSYKKEWFQDIKNIQALESDVLLWSGTRDKSSTQSSRSNYAINVPFFKGRGIIPSMGARQLTELLLDSSKVTQYNKWSNGRVDSVIYQNDIEVVDGLYGSGCTKIVESETNVPFSSSKIKVANLLHARPIILYDTNTMNEPYNKDIGDVDKCGNISNNPDKAYIIVSRSLLKCENNNVDDELENNGPRNEIIWGVNVLRDVPGHPDKTDMITVTQASTPAVPSFLIQKVGLKCASDFFKNIRNVNIQ